MSYLIPIDRMYNKVDEMRHYTAFPSVLIRDELVYSVFIRNYLITEATVLKRRGKKMIRFMETGYFSWTTTGWKQCTFREISDMFRRIWSGIKDCELQMAANHFSASTTTLFGQCIPVPSMDVGLCMSPDMWLVYPPWEQRRLGFSRHKMDGVKMGRQSCLPWNPPGSECGICYVRTAVVNNRKCRLYRYRPEEIDEEFRKTLDAFCVLYGTSWDEADGLIEVARI